MILEIADKHGVVARFVVDGKMTYHEKRSPQDLPAKPTVMIPPPDTIVLEAERIEQIKDWFLDPRHTGV